MGMNEDPAKTASTTSSVAKLRSNAESFRRRDLRGLDDNRTVVEFLSRLVETFLVVSPILE